MIRILMVIAVSVFAALGAQAKCIQDNDVVTLKGTLVNKTIKLDPNDFGWVPADGIVGYTALVIQDPICLNVDGEDSDPQTIIQVGFGEETQAQAEKLGDGARVTLTGNLFGAHTAHHFQDTVLLVSKIQK